MVCQRHALLCSDLKHAAEGVGSREEARAAEGWRWNAKQQAVEPRAVGDLQILGCRY